MSKRQFITLRTRNSNEEVVIEMPGDQPIAALMPDLLKVLNWPQTSGSQKLHYYLQTERDDRLEPRQTLSEAEIDNFDVLWIMLDNHGELQAKDALDASSRILGREHSPGVAGEEALDLLPPPVWASLPIDQPCLVSDSGLIFMLEQSTMVIGRRSREGIPQIDLTELDTGFISSRRHAEILFSGGRYVLRAFNTRNGTLVNGTNLAVGETCALNDGDALQFGFRGVQLVFRMPRT